MFRFSKLGFVFWAFSLQTFAFSFDFQTPRALRNWDSFAIVGDAGKRTNTTEVLRNTLIENKMFRLILPGDNNYGAGNTYSAIWDVWKESGFQFPLVAIGNHNKGYGNEVAYFQIPKEYYAFESKGALFLVLNSDNERNQREQLTWLDQMLTQSKHRMNFLVYHHPSVTLSELHEWEEKKVFQLGMRSLIKKHKNKITSLIVGHDHSAGMYLLDETPLVLSGASWESRKFTRPPKDKDFNVSTLWGTWRGGFWWTKLDYNVLTNEVYIHYNRFDKKREPCTFRLSPKPVSKTRSCNEVD